jgi:DNA-binding NarL/FixJ family response regulator
MPTTNDKESPAEGPTAAELELLRLLVMGFTDHDAATKLGWSRRKLGRVLNGVMGRLGARSRLQAGYLLAEAGWFASTPTDED